MPCGDLSNRISSGNVAPAIHALSSVVISAMPANVRPANAKSSSSLSSIIIALLDKASLIAVTFFLTTVCSTSAPVPSSKLWFKFIVLITGILLALIVLPPSINISLYRSICSSTIAHDGMNLSSSDSSP